MRRTPFYVLWLVMPTWLWQLLMLFSPRFRAYELEDLEREEHRRRGKHEDGPYPGCAYCDQQVANARAAQAHAAAGDRSHG